ncbi:hypothetical protein ONA70_29360 [Micromonospora yasonensis]|uniref:hypothetical protein n=1 Tax=Micromonospora yasonensis TaxID=1128667 RepID=UPI0022327E6A|nr:hypothetical protein [Micromonospora yasonensis]MCW3844205.1 hypothetical protein [Micromonospora yasonensis]
MRREHPEHPARDPREARPRSFMPSSGDEIKDLIGVVDPVGRATACFLATYRLAEICADDRFADAYDTGPEVFAAVLATSEALAMGRDEAATALDGLRGRLEELLGPPGEEFEEPESAGGPWFCDAVSVAAYTIAAWLTPGTSAELCRDALGRVDSAVDFLDRDLAENRPEGWSGFLEPSLSDRELDRQRADLRALLGASEDYRGPIVAELMDASRGLQRRYSEAFQAVTRG